MRHIIKLSFVLLLLCGILCSCTKEKGNYDYKSLQQMKIEFPYKSVVSKVGETFTIEPVFIDPETGEKLEFNIEDYSWKWHYAQGDASSTSAYKLISSKYNLDEALYLPVRLLPHIITLEVTELATGRIFFNHFLLQMISRFISTYAFLVEDDSGNVDLEFYGFDADNNVIQEKNYLSTVIEGYPYTSGGANAISYDAVTRRLYIITGSGLSWLDTPDFEYDQLLNRLENIMIPKETDTFTNMIRMGGTGTKGYERTFLCMTEEGFYLISAKDVITPNMSILANKFIQVAPMAGGYAGQGVVLLWNKTDKSFVWGSSFAQGAVGISKSLTLYNTKIPNITDCVFLGGSLDYEVTGVAKDNQGEYWRIDAYDTRPYPFLAPSLGPKREPKKLVNTNTLGNIEHWLTTLHRGYIYAATNSKLYTYVESQAGGGTADPGWMDVKITDKDGALVNITKPISFLWNDRCMKVPNTNDNYYDYIYIVTYDQATGGTIYIVTPEASGQHLVLVDTMEGLGNVKKMCYWWG